MRERLPLYVLLASALTFLASLFLPWRETSAATFSGKGVQGLLTLFEGGSVEGWIAGAGDLAVLLVVAVVLATSAALRRPQLAARLPIGSLGVALGYFAAAVAVEVHALSKLVGGGFTGHPQTHTSWAYGFYLGIASAAVALLSGLAFRRSELRRPRVATDALAAVLGIAVLISFLLPWFGYGRPDSYSMAGIENPAAAIAALGLILGAGWLHGEAGRRRRLPLAIAVAILTGGAASGIAYVGHHRYGTWIGVGCAIALVALEAMRAWPARRLALPRRLAALRLGAAALLIAALFLPWEKLAAAPGGSYVTDGWNPVMGAAAGGLCLLLLATTTLPALENYVLDAVVAIVILVSTLGTAFRENQPIFKVGYGAFVGLAAAGVLLVTALVPLRPSRVDPRRALPRAVPLAASALCAAAVVVPSWFVLPRDWRFEASPLYGWLSVPALLMALYLIRLWTLRVRGPARTGNRLTLVPLTLLTLPALELIRFRNGVVIWGAVILVGLCLLLALFGRVEEDSGLEGFRVPGEIWRVDRLPEPES